MRSYYTNLRSSIQVWWLSRICRSAHTPDILAICSLEDGYPVAPRDCKYDAFKVKDGKLTYELMLKGMKFKDFPPHGVKDARDPGVPGWIITI